MQKTILVICAALMLTMGANAQQTAAKDTPQVLVYSPNLFAKELLNSFKTKNFEAFKKLIKDTNTLKQSPSFRMPTDGMPKEQVKDLEDKKQTFLNTYISKKRTTFNTLLTKGETLGID